MQYELTYLEISYVQSSHTTNYNARVSKAHSWEFNVRVHTDFSLHTQLGDILSYIIHAEVAWNSTPFKR